MMKNEIRSILLLAFAAMPFTAAVAQTCNTADRSVLLILDASGSMGAPVGSALDD